MRALIGRLGTLRCARPNSLSAVHGTRKESDHMGPARGDVSGNKHIKKRNVAYFLQKKKVQTNVAELTPFRTGAEL